MSLSPQAVANTEDGPGARNLFALGRRAAAARDARHGRRGAFVRARQLLPNGAWRGPRDAAESYVEATDLGALGGLGAARAAGASLLVARAEPALALAPDFLGAAAAAGMRVLCRATFRDGEEDAERLGRLEALAALPTALWGVLPTPDGEPYGLDTLRFFALCRLALPEVPHLLADVTTLGPRLAQMCFGFGADELFGPIVAERALRLGANAHNPSLTRKEAATLIRGAGLAPCERFADGQLEEVTS